LAKVDDNVEQVVSHYSSRGMWSNDSMRYQRQKFSLGSGREKPNEEGLILK